MIKKYTLCFLALIIAACSNKGQRDLSLSRIIKKGTIVCGYKKDTPPLLFKWNSSTRGFLKEFLEIFEKELGIKVILQEVKGQTFLLNALNAGEVDFLVEQNIYTQDHDLFLTSDKVLSLPLSSLHGKGESKATEHFIYAITENKRSLLKEFSAYTPVPSPNPLSIDKRGTLLVNEATSQWFSQEFPKLFSKKTLSQSFHFSIIVRSGEKRLLEAMELALENTLKNPRMDRLSKKWFGATTTAKKFF